jgi:hypothetical protein
VPGRAGKRTASATSDKRDTDKDEVEPDDLKHDDCVELRVIDGVKYWVSAKTRLVYKYTPGSDVAAEKRNASAPTSSTYRVHKFGKLRSAREIRVDVQICGQPSVQIQLTGGRVEPIQN